MTNSEAIRIGIDIGSLSCRVAYVYPDEGRALIPVPLPLHKFPPHFPIAERVGSPFTPRFFPSLLQRVGEDIDLALRDRTVTARALAAEILGRIVAEAGQHSGREIAGGVLSYPVWADSEVRAALRGAMLGTKLAETGLCSSIAAAAAFHDAKRPDRDRPVTVLIVAAGYMGFETGVARLTAKGPRVLAETGEQGTLAGNLLEFHIMASAFHEMKRHRLPEPDRSGSCPLSVWSALRDRVEEAKHQLGDGVAAEFVLPEGLIPSRTTPVKFSLNGEAFRRYLGEHLAHAVVTIRAMLDEVNVRPEDLDLVLLSGGTTHFPGVVRGLSGVFGTAEVHHMSAEAIAGGAAYLALEGIGEDRVTEAPGQGPGSFRPSVSGVPTLVSLLSGVEESPSLPAGNGSSQVIRPDEISLDTLTMAEIRNDLRDGQVHRAREKLRRLRDAVDEEIGRIDSQAAAKSRGG